MTTAIGVTPSVATDIEVDLSLATVCAMDVEVDEHTEINFISLTSGGHTETVAQGMPDSDDFDTTKWGGAFTYIDGAQSKTHLLTNAIDNKANFLAVGFHTTGERVPVSAVYADGVAMTRVADTINGYFGQNVAGIQLWYLVRPAGWTDDIEISHTFTKNARSSWGAISGHANTLTPGVAQVAYKTWLTGVSSTPVDPGGDTGICIFLTRPTGQFGYPYISLSGSSTGTNFAVLDVAPQTDAHNHPINASVGGQAQWVVFVDEGVERLDSDTVTLITGNPIPTNKDDIDVTVSN